MTHFFLFLWVSFLVTFTPGPSILFAVSQGMRMGFWGAVPGLLGNLTASIAYGLISACSVGYFLRTNPHLLQGVAFIGSAYLIAMGMMMLFRKKNTSPLTKMMIEAESTQNSIYKDFLDGFIVNLSNPKIMLFYLIVIPQFASTSDTMIVSLIALALIQNAMKAGSLVFYSALAFQLRTWFTSIDQYGIQRISGFIIIIAGFVLMLDNIY